MSRVIPFIRAAAIVPIRRWLDENGRDATPFLDEADLGWVPRNDPIMPIPLRNGGLLLRAIARAEGPDLPHRIIDGRDIFELGLVAVEAFQGETVRDALHRMARAMPRHCTSEILRVWDAPGALRADDGWSMKFGDDEVLHLVQQYCIAIVEMVCTVAGGSAASSLRARMVAHPDAGLSHLEPWLGDRVHAHDRRVLELELPDEAADRPIPATIRAQATLQASGNWPPLRQGETLSDDVERLLNSMLPHVVPTVDSVALAAGLARRTLQRRLGEEGRSFSDLVESARAGLAFARLQGEEPPTLRDLAAELGYSHQATLTRALRRWSGMASR